MANNNQSFEAIRVVGGLLGSKVLNDARRYQLQGQTSEDYGVEPGLTFNEEIGRYWRIARARWKEYQTQIEREDICSHKLAQEEWLIPLLTRILGYQIESSLIKLIDEREFPITHSTLEGAIPFVLCGAEYDLDKGDAAFGQEGRKRSPMGLVQEYLNAESTCLWAIVSNGTTLRLLRDNPAMTRPAYIEVDFARLFDEDNYADFATLWLLMHATRLAPRNDQVEQCYIEQWREKGQDEGERALDSLRDGVEQALRELGQGFLTHIDNSELRALIAKDQISTDTYFQQVLKLVYRFLFLLTAEDRNVALLPDNHSGMDYRAARKLYIDGYSLSSLRERSRQRRFYDHHSDAWQQLLVTFSGFGTGEELLAQPALGGLFSQEVCAHLDNCQIENKYVYSAIYNLSYFIVGGAQSRINYRDMDTEEFGSVYESLLELTPRINPEGQWTFGFMGDVEGEEAASGHSRKLTGSYYTPDSLVQELVKTALEPVIRERLKENPQQPREAILSIKVCDPACGSGHFLLSAARRLAAELANIDAGTDQATDLHYRHAMRDVVQSCIHGVDLNPMAVELCKTGLWLESIEPGKPLSFMDAHIQNGNALLGITDPEQLTFGIPNAAFKALSGDDKQLCKVLGKANSDARKAFVREKENRTIPLALENSETLSELLELEMLPEDTVEQIECKNRAYKELRDKASSGRLKQAADLFMAAFLASKSESAVPGSIPNNQNLYLCLYTDQPPSQLTSADQADRIEFATKLCLEHKVLHWPIRFAQIFSGEKPGFDCVLGNPPWERIKLQEEEFFSTRSADIVAAKNKSERSQRIQWLSEGMLAKHLYSDTPYSDETSRREVELFNEFIREKRFAEAASAYVHINDIDGGRFPLTGVGDVNTYALFSETIRQVISSNGRAGFIVPSGLVTDKSTKDYFGELIFHKSLDSFFEFENKGFFKGAGQGHMLRFALTTIVGSNYKIDEARFLFQGKKIEHLHDPERVFTLGPEDIQRVNPNTLTCPIFQSKYDAELTKKMYQSIPVLIREAKDSKPELNTWNISFMAMFHMSNDSHLFSSFEDLSDKGFYLEGNTFLGDSKEYTPLYESKMIHLYSHRHGDFKDSNHQRSHVLPGINPHRLEDPEYLTTPFYWVPKDELDAKKEHSQWKNKWFLAWRRITDARASARTLIASVIPNCASGDSLFLPLLGELEDKRLYACFLANMGAIVLDYITRQKLGGLNLNYFTFKQLPFLAPDAYSEVDIKFISQRVGVLTYVANDLSDWANDIGIDREPYSYDLSPRAIAQAELDAYYAKLYGVSRNELQFILDPESIKPGYPSETFGALKRAEMKKYGEFRTQRLVLEAWDKLECGELQ